MAGIDFEFRKQWDTAIEDFKIFYQSPDGLTETRCAYNFKSPASLITSDRDFYIIQFVRKDFPLPGDWSIFTKSLPTHSECPVLPGRVRAIMHIAGFIYRPKIDEATGETHSDTFFISSVDIQGWVPNVLVNNFSASAPRKSILESEKGGILYRKQHS